MSENREHRRSWVLVTATAILIGLGPFTVPGAASEPPANLARNPSFEQAAANAALPALWSGTPQVYSLDPGVVRSGEFSLKYANQDPQRYVLCTQKVPLQAGWKCRASAWIKTQDIAGEESGATICLEWQGPDGKWLGGVYPTGVKGTRDWTRVEAITRLPEDAVSCTQACYVRQEMTGTAWFDDVELVRIADPPMQSVLLSPNYSIKDWYAGSAHCPKSIRSEADEEPMVRDRVRRFRDHPALLAWYLNDELPQRFLPQLEAHQRWVLEEDPNHPTWVVLYQVREVAAYLRTFDVIGTDPYPIGRSPASLAAQWTAETFRQVEGSRPLWQVPQLHNWANYAQTEAEKQRGRTPTYDEVRSMAWQCICQGATGLVFYSWYDVRRNPDVPFDVQWAGLQRLAAEIDQRSPVLLSIEPVPAVTVAGNTPGWLHWLARVHGGKLYLVAVNDGDGEGPVAFRLPAVPTAVRELGENRIVESDKAALPVHLPRLAVHCYEIELTSR